jgi:hypothetical protein
MKYFNWDSTDIVMRVDVAGGARLSWIEVEDYFNSDSEWAQSSWRENLVSRLCTQQKPCSTPGQRYTVFRSESAKSGVSSPQVLEPDSLQLQD